MCGIFGVINKQIEPVDFESILDRLSHRGPDGSGIWQENTVSLGHRRLSILDLSEQGKQPFEVLDRYVITFNGELYNFIEIKKQLLAKGYKFRSTSDTEVLIYAFVEWGKDCLSMFNGMWAFAIWDRVEKKLFISRDRMGKKPLFYIHHNGFFAFASEMKALYPLLQSIDINHDVVEKFRKDAFSYEGTEDCLIKGIKRFPRASYGTLEGNKLEIKTFWDPLETLIQVPSRYEEQCEMFRELFLDACKIRMRSDVALGTALSGGIDSSATICAMNYVSKNLSENTYNSNWQNAFIASFKGTELDETHFAREVTNYINIPAVELEIDPLKDIDKLFYYSYLFEDLYITSPIPFVQLYGQIKKSGVTVTLDGHGADELFAGYPFDLINTIKDDFPNVFRLNDTIRAYYDCLKIKAGPAEFFHLYKMQIGNIVKGRLGKKIPKLDHLNNQLYSSTFEKILPTLLRNYDRYSMINGVEIRMPFLDHRIVSFAFSIPASSKVRNGFAKSIIRDSLRGIMPEVILQRKDKIGFNSPITNWFKGPLKSWITDELHSETFRQSTLIQKQAVTNQIVNQVINNPTATYSDGEKAWTMLMPYIWEKSLRYASSNE